MITRVLKGAEGIREKVSLPCRVICAGLGVPRSNYYRWKAREKTGQPVIITPGPKKVVPLEIASLKAEIQDLGHRRKLSYGTGDLYRCHQEAISRRDFYDLVQKAREEANRERRNGFRLIQWHYPNLAWGMDDLECKYRDQEGQKLYANRMQDLASRYKFSPMAGDYPCGTEVAGYLEAHFRRFGAPLFLKRDNRGNLNHTEVDEILEKYSVIPLNSPSYYAPYNGGIEKSQREFQESLREKLFPRESCPRDNVQAYAEAVEHDLNHRPRPSLKGKNSCQAYFGGRNQLKFNKKQRRDIYDWTKGLASDIIAITGDNRDRAVEAAWRIAVETWLRQKKLITVTRGGKVLPHFSEILSHN